MSAISAAICAVPALCLVIAAISDLRTMTIPNPLCAVLLASFLVAAPTVGLAWADIGMSLVAGLAVFAVCFGLFALNVMGGGDAKLLTAIAVWYGFDHSLLVFLVTTGYVGGAVTLVVLLLRSQAGTVTAMGIPLPPSLSTAKKIPYGVAIAIAGLLTFGQSPIYLLATRALQ